jgi:predicted PurR-regulated permease PerM
VAEGGLISTALAAVSLVVFMLVVPVVAFYLLAGLGPHDRPGRWLLPRDHAPTVRRSGREIDDVLAAFVRGQVSVCLILGRSIRWR